MYGKMPQTNEIVQKEMAPLLPAAPIRNGDTEAGIEVGRHTYIQKNRDRKRQKQMEK